MIEIYHIKDVDFVLFILHLVAGNGGWPNMLGKIMFISLRSAAASSAD